MGVRFAFSDVKDTLLNALDIAIHTAQENIELDIFKRVLDDYTTLRKKIAEERECDNNDIYILHAILSGLKTGKKKRIDDLIEEISKINNALNVINLHGKES
jgi:hypothetical protein